ncbi:MAG: hypothetical protein CMF52_06055 [Legionellales bacterium]|nr:hypothetical protein [Legionellales bacterium]
MEIIGWKAIDRVRRKKSRDEKGHALSLTTQRPTKETAGEQTGAATSHNAATKPGSSVNALMKTIPTG